MNNTACTECKDLVGNKHKTMDLQVQQEHLKYTEHLDSGGLIYPSNSFSEMMQVAYNIFNICVASDLERKFVNVHNQRQTLIGIIEQYITILSECIIPKTTYLTRLLRALICLSNVCLNNHSKNMSDKSSFKKHTNKKEDSSTKCEYTCLF